MKNKYPAILALAVVIIGFGAYAFWQFKPRESISENITADSSSSPESFVSTAHPAKRSFTLQINWIGTVESQSSVELTALVAGRVMAIDTGDQQAVETGQSIMRLGGPQIEDARARFAAAVESLETQVQLARESLARLEENLKTRLATKDQIAAAQEAKVKLEMQLRDARLNLETLNRQSDITSPMNGIFTNRQVSVGQDVAAGQIVGDIIATDRLRVQASLFPPRDIELQGKVAVIRLHEGQTVTGVVQQVLPTTSTTGAVTVWIEGPEINAHLHPGETVGGIILADAKSGALAVPDSAIVYDAEDHPFLFVRKDGTYAKLAIQKGMEQDGWVEIVSGLAEDQLVVVRGAYELFYRQFNEQFKVRD